MASLSLSESSRSHEDEKCPAPCSRAGMFRKSLRQLQQAGADLQGLELEDIAEALPEEFSGTDSAPFQRVCLRNSLVPSVFVTTLLNIACGSVWGVLARKGITALTSYTGAYLSGVVCANFVACYVMGAAVESEVFWASLLLDKALSFSVKGTIPVFAAITTGFCGSCSSFSSMVLEMFSAAANLPPVTAAYPNAAYGILGAFEVLLTHLGLSSAGFYAGKHAARYLEHANYSIGTRTYRVLELLNSALGVGGYIAALVLVGVKPASEWRTWTLSVVFAPWGAIARYLLSRRLNSITSAFLWGTYTANVSGSILLAVLQVLVRGGRRRLSAIPLVANVNACGVLVGLDDGFCGCLTTVSTFIVELCALQTGHSYIYGAASVGTSFACMLLIFGSYTWTVGITRAVC